MFLSIYLLYINFSRLLRAQLRYNVRKRNSIHKPKCVANFSIRDACIKHNNNDTTNFAEFMNICAEF